MNIKNIIQELKLFPTSVLRLEFCEEVDSEAISKVEYLPDEETLVLTFRKSGVQYEYHGVPLEEFTNIYKASSRGTYINQVFKKKGYIYNRRAS